MEPTTTEGSEPVRDLRNVVMFDGIDGERARFLDSAALAALPVMLEKWEKVLMDGDSEMTMANVNEYAAQDSWIAAESLLAERDRRGAEAKP